jgi:uncharacterized protein involved in outer membrane biogenesis
LKVLRRVALFFFLPLLVLAAGALASVYFFKDRLIRQFIEEANKNLNTPVNIGKIDVDWWDDFPRLSLVFEQVYVEDSHPEKFPLLEARRISFSLDPLEVWRGNYTISGLRIADSKTYLKIDAKGRTNYNILKESSAAGEGPIRFDLRNVRLINTIVSYQDEAGAQDHVFQSDKLITTVRVDGLKYSIVAQGDVTTRQIGLGNRIFLHDKLFMVKTRLVYDDEINTITFEPSTLETTSSVFGISGQYAFQDKNEIDLTVIGQDTDVQTLVSLLPENEAKALAEYRSEGDVFFELKLKGEISERKDPLLSISFGFSNAVVFHPEYKARLRKLNLRGSFTTASFTDLTKARLFLKDISGELNEQPFQGDFSMQNFSDPMVTLAFSGLLDAADVAAFYPLPDVYSLTGQLKADMRFEGEVNKLKMRATAQQVKTEGSVELRNVSLRYGPRQVPLSSLSGQLQFNNNDLALSNVTGVFGKSDFQLNGFFKNIITYFLFEGQPIGIETDLKSRFIDLDEVLVLAFGNETTEAFSFQISPLVHLNFNCDVNDLRYKRFHGRGVKGDLLVKNQMAVSRKIDLQAMGGRLSFNGIVDAQRKDRVEVASGWKLDGIHVDSIFYVFENFYQDFIEDKHLKGQATAEVALELSLTPQLKLMPETLVADITATIRNGQLNNFEPLQALNRYLDDEGLARLRFSDLKNDIHIENQTIYIPQMEIKSNVTTIQLSGTHMFDQRIDYRVAAPLRNKKQVDPDEAFGAIEEDKTGKARVFFKITGTTDDYNVIYDKDAVKKKISADLRKEVQELKDAFKLKGQKKKKELELTTEEFDWDNP